MDCQKALKSAIGNAYPQILKEFTADEFLAFRNAGCGDIVCGSRARERIRDWIIGEDSALLRAFINCGYADRDDMTEYVLQEFKDYLDG